MFLALESSTSTGSVAVGMPDRAHAETMLDVVGAHSSALLPAVDGVVRATGLEPGALTGVAVGAGPGSFTGVRIAAATAKGIVHGLGVPLFAYSSLLVAAVSGMSSGRAVCALFDARRRDVFAGCWRFDADAITPVMAPTALSIDDVVARFGGDEPPLFVGDGAVQHQDELRRALGASILPAPLGVPRASALLWLMGRVPELGRVDDPASWEPDYVREPGAVRIAAGEAR